MKNLLDLNQFNEGLKINEVVSKQDIFGGHDEAQIREAERMIAQLYGNVTSKMKARLKKFGNYFKLDRFRKTQPAEVSYNTIMDEPNEPEISNEPEDIISSPEERGMVLKGTDDNKAEKTFIEYLNSNFDIIRWNDVNQARILISLAKKHINENSDLELLQSACKSLHELIER